MERLQNHRGVAIIYITLFLLVLGLLFVALGVDLGWLAFVRSQGQAAVDAAALRGAAAIPNYNNNAGDPANVHSMVTGINSDNNVMNQSAGLAGSDVEFCTGSADNPTCPSATIPAGGIKVKKAFTAPLYFGKLFKSGNTSDISVSSIAWLGGPGGLRPELPIALCAQQIAYNPDPNNDGSFTCKEYLDTDLTPNNVDNAGWWAPIGVSASNNACRQMVNGQMEIPYVGLFQDINLNNGEFTSCLKTIEDKFAAAGCFQKRITEPIYDPVTGEKIGENVIQPGVEGTQCDDSAADPSVVDACTVTLPVVNCPNSINQQQPVIGYASVCIKYVQANPASSAVTRANLECNVQVDAIGGGPTLGTYASRPVLVK